jgi:hypothetical protein
MDGCDVDKFTQRVDELASPYSCGQGWGVGAAVSGHQATFGGPDSKAVGFLRVQKG